MVSDTSVDINKQANKIRNTLSQNFLQCKIIPNFQFSIHFLIIRFPCEFTFHSRKIPTAVLINENE